MSCLNNKYFQFCLIFFLIIGLNLKAQSDSISTNVSLKTYLENDYVPLNKEVVFHVELSWLGDLSRYQIDEIVEPSISGLNLRGSGSSNKLTIDENGSPFSTRRVSYYFSPQSIGMAYIDGLNIRYKDANTGDIETLIAQRIAIKIIDPVPSENDMYGLGTFYPWILLIFIISFVAYFGWRYIQRRNSEKVEPKIEKSLEEKYLDLMKDNIHLTNNAQKENVSSLSKLLNNYISEKFSIHGSTDAGQIETKLKDLKIDKDIISKIGSMNSKVELARFAAEEISSTELHLFYDSIEYILKEVNNNENNNAGN